MNTLGQKIIAEFYRCNSTALGNTEQVRESLLNTAELINARVLESSFHQFSPQGVSGVVIIAESHIAIHTWPESRYAAVDLYTCGGIDPTPGYELLAKLFEAEEYRVVKVIRGTPEDTSDCEEDPLKSTLLITRFPACKLQFSKK